MLQGTSTLERVVSALDVDFGTLSSSLTRLGRSYSQGGCSVVRRTQDTRSLQAYIGPKNIQHTVLSPDRFKDLGGGQADVDGSGCKAEKRARGGSGGRAMRIAIAALLAGSLGASQIVLAQTPTPTAPSTAPSTAPTPPPSSSEATGTRLAEHKRRSALCSNPGPTATPMKQMTVSDLTDKDLVGAKDNEVGEIEGVVESTANKKQHLVISRGGFLGLFETEVLVPWRT